MGSDKYKTTQKTTERSNKDQIFSGKTAPIRVAQVIGKWKGGGVESVVMNYYRHIDRNKIQFDFLIDEDSTNIPTEEIEKLGGKIILIPPYQKLPKYIKALKKIFKENNYHIVHSHINTLSVFPLYAAKKAGVKVRIAHSHSTSNPKEVLRNIIKYILKPLSKKYATDYFACSEFAGRWLFGNKAFDKGKVTIIHNAIDIDKFKFDEKARKSIRQELEIAEDTLVIGHVGRFMKQKNHTFLIEVFNEVHKENPNSKLILVGEGPLLEKIKEKAKKLGLNDSVLFLGQRKDVNKLYSAMDVFCLPSLYEGLPVVGIEAQAASIKCIFSNNITAETVISKNTDRLKINRKMWVDAIVASSAQSQKKTKINIQYNIHNNVDLLEKMYGKFHEYNSRVLYFMDSLEIGGIQTLTFNWALELRKKDIEVDFLVLDYGYVSSIESQLKKNKFNVYKINGINFNSPLYLFNYRKKIINFFKRNNNYCAIHLHGSSKNYQVLKYAKRYGIRVRIAHAHSSNFKTNNFIKKMIGSIFKKSLKKYSTILCACSENAAKWLFGKNNNDPRIKTIKNAIKTENYLPNDDIREKMRARLGVKEKQILIGQIGRLVPVKNHNFSIKLFEKLSVDNDDYRMIFVGDGELRGELENNITKKQLGKKIALKGSMNNIGDILQAIDIIIMPSLFEGLPMSLIEAQASGTKCIVSDQISREADITGDVYFVSLQDIDTWTNIIRNINTEKNNNSRKINKNGFCMDEVVFELIEMYGVTA